jgi:hypothetical protein
VHAVVAARASIVTHVRSVLFSVLSDIGTPSSLDVQQIADQRRAISAFGVGLSRQAQTESTSEVVLHEVRDSLGIVGHAGWGTREDLPLTSRFSVRSIPTGVRIRAGFDSRRGDCGDRNGMGRACCRGACCFIFASYYRASSCWYFRWYRPPSTTKTTSNSNGYGIRRLPARGTNLRCCAASARQASRPAKRGLWSIIFISRSGWGR